MNNIYSLHSEDLSHLGGLMGTEYTTTNWIKYFTSAELAKEYAEKDFGKSISWKAFRPAGHRSGDLRYVAYTIQKIKIVK